VNAIFKGAQALRGLEKEREIKREREDKKKEFQSLSPFSLIFV
jgi:hypothetical protein